MTPRTRNEAWDGLILSLPIFCNSFHVRTRGSVRFVVAMLMLNPVWHYGYFWRPNASWTLLALASHFAMNLSRCDSNFLGSSSQIHLFDKHCWASAAVLQFKLPLLVFNE